MFFISRVRDYGSYVKYGVVDTDDGKEQFVMPDEIEKAYKAGIEIAGAVIENGRAIQLVPYQSESSMTVRQTKVAAMYGISVTMYRDEVTSINVDCSQSGKSVRLRLSDLAKSCSDRLFINANVWGDHRLTLVLDDSIRFNTPAFYLPGRRSRDSMFVGVRFDVSKLSDNRSADKIYHAVAFSQHQALDLVILDTPERKKRMMRKYGDRRLP